MSEDYQGQNAYSPGANYQEKPLSEEAKRRGVEWIIGEGATTSQEAGELERAFVSAVKKRRE